MLDKTFAMMFHKTFAVMFHKTIAVMFHKVIAVMFHKTMQQCCQIEIRKNPESRPKKSQNAVVFLKKSRDFLAFHDDVISFLYYIERVIILYGSLQSGGHI